MTNSDKTRKRLEEKAHSLAASICESLEQKVHGGVFDAVDLLCKASDHKARMTATVDLELYPAIDELRIVVDFKASSKLEAKGQPSVARMNLGAVLPGFKDEDEAGEEA